MKRWLYLFTPFRLAAVLSVIAILVLGVGGGFRNTGGGSAWGGVAFIALLFFGIVFWLVDLLMRHLIPDKRIIWVIQLPVLLAMYLFVDWS